MRGVRQGPALPALAVLVLTAVQVAVMMLVAAALPPPEEAVQAAGVLAEEEEEGRRPQAQEVQVGLHSKSKVRPVLPHQQV